jgi:parallel beta-helix repeat protein
MNRAVFALAAILCLLSVPSMTGLIQVVKADGVTIYINADGSISPSTAPIYTADKIKYTLTGNVTTSTNGIVVERDNIVLDGAGYTVTGSGSADGILLETMRNVTIDNMVITNTTDGILFDSSSNCNLSGNNVANNYNGIALTSSSDNNTLSGNNVAKNYIGIFLGSSSNCALSGNDVTANSDDGIWFESSSNNMLSGNDVTNNPFGIEFSSSSNCALSGNDVTANSTFGIYLDSSSNCTFAGNSVTANNEDGIFLGSSSNCVLSGNNVTANGTYGIVLSDSSNNFIFHNDFVNNTIQVYTDGLANVWDNGSSGNYWSDYVTKYPNATQVDSSGVWNTPYIIDTNNTDHYPLMVPYAVVPEFPSIQATMFFILLTLLTVIIYKKKGVRSARTNRHH